MLTGKEPPKDPEKDLFFPSEMQFFQWEQAASRWLDLDRRKADLERQLKALKKEQSQAVSELVDLMGDFLHGEACGVKVTRYQVQGRIDYKKVVEDKLPDLKEEDLEPFRGKGRMQVRVSPAKNPEKKEKEETTRVKAVVESSKQAEDSPLSGVAAW